MQYNYSTIPFISNTERTYIRTLIAAHDWDTIGKGVHRKQSTIKHNTRFKVHIIMMSNIEDWGTFRITHLKRRNYYSRVYTSTVLTRVKYNPGQNNPGYICVASTHDIPHARARHCECDGGKRSRNRYFNLSML